MITCLPDANDFFATKYICLGNFHFLHRQIFTGEIVHLCYFFSKKNVLRKNGIVDETKSFSSEMDENKLKEFLAKASIWSLTKISTKQYSNFTGEDKKYLLIKYYDEMFKGDDL